MNINIRGDKIEVTDSIKNYVKEKLERLDKYFDEPSKIDAHILIRVRNGEQIIEVTIPTSKYTLRAEEKHSDLYAATDLVIDVLERQIRKNKTKLNKHRIQEPIGFAFVPEEDEEYTDSASIMKRKTIESKPMSEEEAILQMELLGHDFFVFVNAETDQVNVVYKRKGNTYGLIEPEF